MTGEVRRAGAFAAVGSLALAAPVLGQLTAVVFLAIAALAAFVIQEGPLFELFARPGDRRDGRLYGLAGFALAAAGLALLATIPVQVRLPLPVFVGSVLLLAYGNLGDRLVSSRGRADIVPTLGFGALGFVGGVAGIFATVLIAGTTPPPIGVVVFLSASGVLLAALLRVVLFERDDPLVMLSAGLLLWFLWLLEVPALDVVATALGVTFLLGYAAYALETASVPGMLTGVFLGLLTLVLGGPAWFATLIAFFGLGGISTKYRYDLKEERGVAEDNQGARGSGNVLGNSAVALLALLGHQAASSGLVAVPDVLFAYAFAGSIAGAMSDTLSSEIGGAFDRPRLITTLDVVDPGTDGAVTWQGEVAGVAGAVAIAAVAVGLGLIPTAAIAAGAVVVAGVVGMSVDSLLGATVEGRWLGNQGVNFFATLAGAAAGAGLAAVGDGVGFAILLS